MCWLTWERSETLMAVSKRTTCTKNILLSNTRLLPKTYAPFHGLCRDSRKLALTLTLFVSTDQASSYDSTRWPNYSTNDRYRSQHSFCILSPQDCFHHSCSYLYVSILPSVLIDDLLIAETNPNSFRLDPRRLPTSLSKCLEHSLSRFFYHSPTSRIEERFRCVPRHVKTIYPSFSRF